ncbi:LCP family protein [Micropruina sp.]|uniref:LCP family protein n=1 Tax=Micropruina sp. TaxID=2737536 RepID=UPI0039E6553E
MVVAATAVGSLWLSLSGITRDPTLLPGRDVVANTSDGSINLLLVGTETHLQRGAANVLMLVHVDAARNDVYLISLPRNLLIESPGAEPTTLGRVYADQGAAGTVLAVEQLLGIRVQHVALTWLNGMSRLIDLVDGVPIDNPVESNSEGFPFPRGELTLSGEEALAFVRQGVAGPGELDPAESERLVLQGIATRLLTNEALTNPGTVKAVLDQLATDVVVDSNLDARRMVELFVELRAKRSAQNLSALKLPTAAPGTLPSGNGYVRPDDERVASLGRAINADAMDEWMPHP